MVWLIIEVTRRRNVEEKGKEAEVSKKIEWPKF